MGTCQDEPEQLDDWNRIAELQQRNRVCPPHLKTCYPLESRVSSEVTCIGLTTLDHLCFPWHCIPVPPADPAQALVPWVSGLLGRVTVCFQWNGWQGRLAGAKSRWVDRSSESSLGLLSCGHRAGQRHRIQQGGRPSAIGRLELFHVLGLCRA